MFFMFLSTDIVKRVDRNDIFGGDVSEWSAPGWRFALTTVPGFVSR